MLTIKADEGKDLYFDVLVEGIDDNLLTFMFRLNINGVEYGFPCITENGGKIKVPIPALDTILVEGTSGIFKGKLEGVGDGKYYMNPWEDNIEIKIEPKVTAKPEIIKEEASPTSMKVKAYLTGDNQKAREEEHKENKEKATKHNKEEAKSHNKALRTKLS